MQGEVQTTRRVLWVQESVAVVDRHATCPVWSWSESLRMTNLNSNTNTNLYLDTNTNFSLNTNTNTNTNQIQYKYKYILAKVCFREQNLCLDIWCLIKTNKTKRKTPFFVPFSAIWSSVYWQWTFIEVLHMISMISKIVPMVNFSICCCSSGYWQLPQMCSVCVFEMCFPHLDIIGICKSCKFVVGGERTLESNPIQCCLNKILTN